VEIRETPNPNVRQFIPGGLVAPQGSLQAKRAMQDMDLPLFQDLLNLEDIQEIFLGYDFLTIQALPAADWNILSQQVLDVLKKHSFPIVASLEKLPEKKGETRDETPLEPESIPNQRDDIIHEIQCLFEERVQPAVAMDGGEILFKGFQDGIVYVEMRGACSGCPQSSATLKGGVERLLQYYIPEVLEIRILGQEDSLEDLSLSSKTDLSGGSLESLDQQSILEKTDKRLVEQSFEPIINEEES
jgi:Fe-S cluster biogenesis protein NfuA